MIFNRKKFQELREIRKLTQKQIATACEVSEAIVCNWEKGKYNPRPNKIPKLAAVLGCREDELAAYGKTMTPESLSWIISCLEQALFELKKYEKLKGKDA